MIPSDGPQPASLRTPRLELEPLNVEHAAEMVAVLADPEIYRFTGGGPPTEAELRERYHWQVLGRSTDGTERWLNWVVRRIADRQAVGFVQATLTPDQAEVAWVIGLPYQRHGLAKEAVTAMVDWLRGQGHSAVIAHVYPGHLASEAVARSIGLMPTDQLLDGETRWQ